MMRYDIINHFIRIRDFTSYLELGVQNPQNCFDKILCAHKAGVDPDSAAAATFAMTSDDYFASTAGIAARYDIIFIDADHRKEAVERDAKNALKCLNENGVIILHDCLPVTEQEQLPEPQPGDWTGDGWKFFVQFRRSCGYKTYTISEDHGVGIIDTSKQVMIYPPITADLDWNWYCCNKVWALGLTDKIK